MENKFRALIKTDTRTIQEISKLAGIHHNTITRLIKPDFTPVDRRVQETMSEIARLYGYDVKVRLDFVPIGNGDEN